MSSFTLVVYDTIMKLQFYHRFCSVLFTSLSPESKKMTYKSYSVNICLMYSIEKRQIPLFMLSLQWQPTLALLPGKSRDGGVWWAAVHGVTKSRTQLSDFTFTFHFHGLEKEMATHSSVLTWRIPGTAEPSGLLSVGSHRVGHD